ncbi:MAG: hypothetical protein Q4A82_02665 [Corynebacterium sp.]|nr:hypothetical protein [Corynebacterium sp.]
MKLAKIFRAPEAARITADFVEKHCAEQSAKEYFSDPRFTEFLRLVREETWADAAKEYREVTGEDIRTSAIAAKVARRIFRD